MENKITKPKIFKATKVVMPVVCKSAACSGGSTHATPTFQAVEEVKKVS